MSQRREHYFSLLLRHKIPFNCGRERTTTAAYELVDSLVFVRPLQLQRHSNYDDGISECCLCQRKLTYSYLRILMSLTATEGHEFRNRGGKNPPSRASRRRRTPAFMDGLDRLKLFWLIPRMYNAYHNRICMQEECKCRNKCSFGQLGSESIYFGEGIQTITRCTRK